MNPSRWNPWSARNPEDLFAKFANSSPNPIGLFAVIYCSSIRRSIPKAFNARNASKNSQMFFTWNHTDTNVLRRNDDFAGQLSIEVNDPKMADLYILKEIVDPGVQLYKCAICGMTTARKSSVARHLTTVHAPKKDLKCDVCGVVYKNDLAFQEHMRRKKCYDKPLDKPIEILPNWE